MLTLSEAVPYLTVTVKQREYYVEDVMYDVEYTDSAYLYKGDYQVTSPGEYGAADVVANVTYVNGVETERTILSSPAVAETTYYTAGLGFSLSRSVYLDVAYCYVKDTTTPYMLFYGNRYADDEAKTEIYQSEVYTTDFTRHNVALTLGFRF